MNYNKLIIQLNKIMEISLHTQSVKESIRPGKHTVALDLLNNIQIFFTKKTRTILLMYVYMYV